MSLAGLTSFLAKYRITSISGSYYEGGWSQIILIGFLFAIAAFLLAYDGLSTREMVLSKVASVAALGVAIVPLSFSKLSFPNEPPPCTLIATISRPSFG